VIRVTPPDRRGRVLGYERDAESARAS
jgi:hypothetical protein